MRKVKGMIFYMEKKILVVDDEKKLLKVIKAYLEKEGYIVKTVSGGNQALEVVKDFQPDLMVLDLMLPEISGEEVCQRVRRESSLPILMLTAKGGEDDKVKGFSYGADDYLVKPFSLSELLARIKAILRRSDYSAAKADVLIYQNGKIRVFPAEMKVLLDQEDATLTKTEFDILYVLLKNPGQVFSRDKLAEKVMGLEFKGFDRTIDAHIKNIRKKLQLDKNQFIITVYGAGYKFEGDKDE